ncbi:MAG: amino acid permease [Vicinamibacterales bacterium]
MSDRQAPLVAQSTPLAPARPRLGLWTLTALVVGNMIGSGVFLLPASLAPYGGISIIGWLFTTAGALLLALSFARLSRMVPGAGGPYAYTRAGFGDFTGFLIAWGYWISICAGNAAIATAFVGYLAVFVPPLAATPGAAAAAALAAIWMLTWVNALGVKRAGLVQLATTVLKLLPLAAIALFGFARFEPAHFVPFNPTSQGHFGALTAAAALTLWAFLGLESATVPADDVHEPERTIPRATILGTLLASVVYVVATVAVMGVVPRADLATSTAPFADAAQAFWGEWGRYLVGAGAVISCFGCLNGWILLQGQLPYAAARDGLFPSIFAGRSRSGAPTRGLVVSSAFVTVLILFNYTRSLVDLFTFVVLLATLTSLVPYLFSTMSEVLILAGPASGPRGRFCGIAPRRLLAAALAFAYALWAIAGSGMETVYWGFLLLMAGIPVYVVIRSSR